MVPPNGGIMKRLFLLFALLLSQLAFADTYDCTVTQGALRDRAQIAFEDGQMDSASMPNTGTTVYWDSKRKAVILAANNATQEGYGFSELSVQSVWDLPKYFKLSFVITSPRIYAEMTCSR